MVSWCGYQFKVHGSVRRMDMEFLKIDQPTILTEIYDQLGMTLQWIGSSYPISTRWWTLQHHAGIHITSNFVYLDDRWLTTLRELSKNTDIRPSLHWFEDPNFLRWKKKLGRSVVRQIHEVIPSQTLLLRWCRDKLYPPSTVLAIAHQYSSRFKGSFSRSTSPSTVSGKRILRWTNWYLGQHFVSWEIVGSGRCLLTVITLEVMSESYSPGVLKKLKTVHDVSW